MLRFGVLVVVTTLVAGQGQGQEATKTQNTEANKDTNSGSSPNTRLFGLGGLVGGLGNVANQALGGGFQQQGHHQQGLHHGQGFNPGFPQQGGGFLGQQVGGLLGQGVGGFNPGYPQQGGGFPGQGVGGFNPGYPQQVGGFQGQVGIIGQDFPGQVGVGVGASGSASCRRWCRTPQGQAYCCESANEALSAALTKQGQCPPVRNSCPPTRGFAPPKQCSSDGGCAGYDKCCFDTCLQHHTCKPPIGLGK